MNNKREVSTHTHTNLRRQSIVVVVITREREKISKLFLHQLINSTLCMIEAYIASSTALLRSILLMSLIRLYRVNDISLSFESFFSSLFEEKKTKTKKNRSRRLTFPKRIRSPLRSFAVPWIICIRAFLRAGTSAWPVLKRTTYYRLRFSSLDAEQHSSSRFFFDEEGAFVFASSDVSSLRAL